MRVVSLLASGTEIVTQLGLGHLLVGRSHECDYPPGVEKLPVCTETKFFPDGKSYEIHQRVQAIVQEGLSVYRVLGERLRELRPDVLITQTQCEVCAVSLRDVEEAAREWLGYRPRIVSLQPYRLADVWDDVRRVATALGAAGAGENLVRRLEDRVGEIGAQAARAGVRPRVAFIEWIDPLMTGGNWAPELIAHAGGESIFGVVGEHSPILKWEDLRQADPDVIVVAPCGFGIPRTQEELGILAGKPGWQALSAVRSARVFVADGNHYFNRSGPRLVDSIEIMAEILHPAAFLPAHRDSGWIQVQV